MTDSLVWNMSTETTLDERLQRHLEEHFGDHKEVFSLSQRFRREGYVKINSLVPEDIHRQVTQEVYQLLDQYAHRIDLNIKETSHSPRRMSTVGQRQIAASGKIIPTLYHSEVLMRFLTRLAQEKVLPCSWEEEKFIITRQERKGDTHGWHWGDFSFTVIWIIEAPALEYGGILQCIPHTNWDKQDPRVHEYILNNPIRSYGHKSGEIYFLRSDTTLHRTIPLTEDKTRIILNTCWGSQADLHKEKTHETMHAMFD